MKARLSVVFGDCKKVLYAVLAKPSMITTPEFAFLSEFVHEVSEMTNSLKRNMLYWWYATNVYLVTGKNNRAK